MNKISFIILLLLACITANTEAQRIRVSPDQIGFYTSDTLRGYLDFDGPLNTAELKSSDGQDLVLSSGATGKLRFRVNSITALMINEEGGIGIGNFVDAPVGYKLAVDGNTICEDLYVELSTDWPDYVFQPEYDLMPLTQLERFLQDHRHLPGLPPASEVEQKGTQAVGQTQRQLLEKIEELTLYILELHKNYGKLSEELEALKESVKAGK